MVTPTFENLHGLISWQPCWRATIFQYNTIENVKNSLANNTDHNALEIDREENMTLSIIRIRSYGQLLLICVTVILMTS